MVSVAGDSLYNRWRWGHRPRHPPVAAAAAAAVAVAAVVHHHTTIMVIHHRDPLLPPHLSSIQEVVGWEVVLGRLIDRSMDGSTVGWKAVGRPGWWWGWQGNDANKDARTCSKNEILILYYTIFCM